MEQLHRPPGGEPEPESPALAYPPETANATELESWDERVIREGIEGATTEGRPIDNRTARYIAGQLHGGQASALYALASSGAIQPEVFDELDRDRVQQTPNVRRWIACLSVYCASRDNDDAIADWIEQAEAHDRAELVDRLSTVGTPLGRIATVHAVELPSDANEAEADEGDHFHWGDAARWSPAEEAAADTTVGPTLSDEQLDALFGGDADEEVGDVQDLGWFGLVRWPDQPGGLILKLDENGLRHTWVVTSYDALTTRWASIANEYGEFYEQRDAYEQATDEPDVTPSGINPKVWVGSLADYVNGDLHGEWFDATCEPAELVLAAKFMLRLGRTPDAEEWAVMDYDGFAGIELSEYESFESISRVAQGIAEHGEAFAHWAAYVGSESTQEIERFTDHYRGEWDSFEACIRDYLEETEFYRFLEQVPEDVRGYVEVDVKQIARDWSCDYHIAELANGRVVVFETMS